MIPLAMEYFFTVYVLAWFFTIGVLWAREHWRSRRNSWDISKDKLCFCDNCHFAFLVKPDENISRCPRCNGICILRKRRNF